MGRRNKSKVKMPQRKPKTPAKLRNYKKPNPVLQGIAGPGRSLKIETPELLYEYFTDFKQWCIDNAYEKFVGLDKGEPVFILQPRALVFKAFEGWLSSLRVVFDLSHYERNDTFRPIIKQIKSECSQQTLQGAMSGLYNANLTSRLEGLVEKTELDLGIDRKQVAELFPFKPKKAQ
jgi:hypothetical protein